MSTASAPARAGPPDQAAASTRLVSLDLVRVAIIVMVIVHHAAQAYGPTGGAWPVTDPASSNWFRPFYTVNASVGLGLLFLVAGYLVPRSYDKKGPRRFLIDRWRRIGIPLVVFALGVHLPLFYLFVSRPPVGELIALLWESGWQGIYLHLWFLGHLLLYSGAYVAWRRFRQRKLGPVRILSPPSHTAILGFVFGLAVLTWIVRWWWPIDDWVPLLGILAAEPANLLQYVSLFVLGAIAHRNDWFRRIPTRVGAVWLLIGLAAAGFIYALEARGRFNEVVATGGANLGSLLLTTLSALICTGLSVGLIVVARSVVRRPLRLLTFMASTSYAAYILHLWIVSGLQAGLLSFDWPVAAKFALVSVMGIALSFGAGHISAKVPGLRTILGTSSR
ncbi:MAG TPA: acyltransferase family protein [Acidimicrobiia bacterium]|nr:acyltransferase family protein [Acidimicrobiia bacterium]